MRRCQLKPTILHQVGYLLDKVPATRDDDWLLSILYWKVFDGVDVPPQVARQLMSRASRPDTITRYKRKWSKAHRGWS